jgi:hypothetical protein
MKSSAPTFSDFLRLLSSDTDADEETEGERDQFRAMDTVWEDWLRECHHRGFYFCSIAALVDYVRIAVVFSLEHVRNRFWLAVGCSGVASILCRGCFASVRDLSCLGWVD